MTSSRLRPLLGAVLALSIWQAQGQSSASFRLEGGKVTASTASTTPTSTGFRAEGGMNASAVSGIATSANFAVASGVTTAPDRVFASGFEN